MNGGRSGAPGPVPVVVAPNATRVGSRASVPAARFAPPVPRSVVDAPNSAPVVISAGVLDRDRAEAARANSTASFCRARLAELSATRMSDTLLRSLDSSRTTRRFSSSRWRMYSTVGCALSSLSVASCTAARSSSTNRPWRRNDSNSNASPAFDAETRYAASSSAPPLAAPSLLAAPSAPPPISSRNARAASARSARIRTSRLFGNSRAGMASVRAPALSATRYDPSSTFRMIWFIASAHR